MSRPAVPLEFAAIGLVLQLASAPASAQVFSQRGWIEGRGLLYPQTTPTDDRRAAADLRVRYEASARPAPWLAVAGGVDGGADTLEQVEREWRVDWQDRSMRRPALSLRRFSALLSGRSLTVELGKQFVRWGKTDVLTPTDRFAPRDYLEVVDNDLLAVVGARATYERSGRTLDLVWVPRLTPSRLPITGSRWAPSHRVTEIIATLDCGWEYPGGSQFGARWSQISSGLEYSLSYFEGYNHLASLESRVRRLPPAVVIVRVFPRIRMYGADASYAFPWFTVKGEAGVFRSDDPRADQYELFVLQVERQSGEWFFVAGYGGEHVSTSRAQSAFAPDRGLTRSFLGRASYTIDANRNLAFEGALRQNGHGTWLRAEYSQASGPHWRATVSGTLIRGREDDFLGQFRLNSHVSAALRYSF